MSVSGVGPGHINSFNQTSNNPAVSKHLKSPQFKNILSVLGINAKDIISISQKNGVHTNTSVQEVKFLQIDKNKAEVLKALGIENAELAIVLSADNEISTIRKRLETIKESAFNKKILRKLLNLLGIPGDENTFVFTDENGGLLVIQSAVSEIHRSIEEEEEEKEGDEE
ncbi:MAG: hypothetical protein GY730_02325 [bacterium]|nr:hypothetical protein [bacterium]